jgi:hypothetical protein
LLEEASPQKTGRLSSFGERLSGPARAFTKDEKGEWDGETGGLAFQG